MFRQILIFALIVAAGPALSQQVESYSSHVTSRSQIESLDEVGLSAAEAGSARALMALGLDLIKDFEQWVPKYYDDASNYCTIGYGHLIAKRPCGNLSSDAKKFPEPMTIDVGAELLGSDTASTRIAIQRKVTASLTDEQFGALTSLVFNIGPTNFGGSTLLKAINNGELDLARLQFGRWVKSNGIVLNGLVSRRACEAALFGGTLAYGADGKFHRDDCGALSAAPAVPDLIDLDVGENR